MRPTWNAVSRRVNEKSNMTRTFGVEALWHAPNEFTIRLASRSFDLLPRGIFIAICDI